MTALTSPAWESPVARDELYLYALRQTGCQYAADDIAQETLIVHLQFAVALDPCATSRGWVYGVIKNRIREFHGRRQHAALDASTDDPVGPGPIDDLLRHEAVNLLLAALSALPPTQREALILRINGYSSAEAAQLLNTTAMNVDQLVGRARKQLTALVPNGLLEWFS